jgi:hypothetical protein
MSQCESDILGIFDLLIGLSRAVAGAVIAASLQFAVAAQPPAATRPEAAQTADGDGTESKPSSSIAQAIESAKLSAAKVKLSNNMKQIQLALLTYNDAKGSFPPAVVYGPDGKPWHSWRVLIVPFLGDGLQAVKGYDFSQPWDSEANLKAAEKGVSAFRNPVQKDSNPGLSGYALLVGEGAVYDVAGARMQAAGDRSAALKGTKISEIVDGISRTVCLVALDPAKRMFWTKPEDVAVDGAETVAAAGVQIFPGLEPSGPGYFHVGFCDGSIHEAPATLDAAVLRAFVSRAGQEGVDLETWSVRP